MSAFDAEQDDTTKFKVVLNHEEQYSIWPSDRENPPGWRDDGKSGPKAECLEYIDQVWIDMRPLSLRKQMEEDAKRRAEQPEPAPLADEPPEEPLPYRLSRGDHAVVVSIRPERTVEGFRERLDLGFVHIKFTDTRGGTELGFPVDKNALDLSGVDFEKGRGRLQLSGP